jgi:hypothetical protein
MNLEVQAHEERHAALMAVQGALTEAERVLLLGNAVRRFGPRMDGAGVADVLDITTNHDMFLAETEPFLERFAPQLPQDAPLGAAMHAVILLKRELTPARVISLLQRAGVMEAPHFPEVEAGLWVYEACHERQVDANHLLIKARAEQGMRAAGVPERVITQFRESVRKTGIPGFSRNAADIAVWVTLVDRYTPMPRKVYEPVHDLAVILNCSHRDYGMGGHDFQQALANLRSHLDLRAVETAEAGLNGFFGRAER